MAAPDRLKLLITQNKITGIDFVYVEESQTALQVFFYHDPAGLVAPLIGSLKIKKIFVQSTSTGDRIPIKSLSWPMRQGKRVMQLTFYHPGDFSVYALRIDDDRIDPRYNNVAFSFKAACESDLDCRRRPRSCPMGTPVDFPVDYQARDFWGFRRALLDFASQRYPDWQDRLEADMGVMLVEVMSALGDELSYFQDRIAREAHLETATQRRSVRHHAKLIDYAMHEGLSAHTWLDVTVEKGKSGDLKPGDDVWAVSDDGRRVAYEMGRGLFDVDQQGNPSKYLVDAKINNIDPHIWHKDEACLQAGATSLYVIDHQLNNLPFNDPPEKPSGRWVLLKTQPESAGLPIRRWLVRLINVEDAKDPLVVYPNPIGHKICKLTWEKSQALPFDIDMNVLKVHGNLVPVTAGRIELKRRFVVGEDPTDLTGIPSDEQLKLTRAIERQGPNGSTIYRFTLPGSDTTPLCWLGGAPQSARPEVRLKEIEWKNGVWEKKAAWKWRPSFLGSPASFPHEPHFVLEDGCWDRVVGYQRSGKEIVHRDYAGTNGKTIRFGDGDFGRKPSKGSIFEVEYRLGNGRSGNLEAESLTHYDSNALNFIAEISNPMAVTNGIEAETPGEVRFLAPDAFRAVTYRAVQKKDYAEAAERLDWVQRAGARFRWTGSWLTAFVTPDPLGEVGLSQVHRDALTDQIDRFRQAGREAHVMNPRYADIDLWITICVEPSAFAGQVKERVLEALIGGEGSQKKAFFHPDNFTFGTPLRRSKLEAVIKRVAGVLAVKQIEIRRRGYFYRQVLEKPYFPVSDRDVIRVENDLLHPERGSVTLIMEGGA